ncbi:MAG: hypothetical protein O3A95_07545 [Planctomycetota bacterium]|nr:hypothetical protein [Planctomycetota bacterium]MDA1114135.1 hypothetical protein [Planctomycetota bacterium]
MLPRFLALTLVLGLGTSCAIPTMDAVRDLAAIHTPTDWQPTSPAQMTTSPANYFGEVDAIADTEGSYAVEDHRQLELAILQRIAQVDISDPARSIEVGSWLLIELAHDDYPEARVEAAKIIANLAGNWILHEDARIVEGKPDADLRVAIQALDHASSSTEFQLALGQLQVATIPDTIVGIRILTALGRTANRFSFTTGQGDAHVFSLALKIILQGLEEGSLDSNKDVAEICEHWHTLLMSRAMSPTNS